MVCLSCQDALQSSRERSACHVKMLYVMGQDGLYSGAKMSIFRSRTVCRSNSTYQTHGAHEERKELSVFCLDFCLLTCQPVP